MNTTETTLADCGVSNESVLNVLIVPSDTQLMQRFLMRTNAKEITESVREYWDVDCCKWNEKEVFEVECDEESGRVVNVSVFCAIEGVLDFCSLPASLDELHVISFEVEPVDFQDLSHLSKLTYLHFNSIPIHPASQFHHLPPSLKRIEIQCIMDSTGTQIRWDFTQLNRCLPNLVYLELVRSNFAGALNFGDRVPRSLKSIALSGVFDVRGADWSALMRDDCNVEEFLLGEMETLGFEEDIKPFVERLKEVKPQMKVEIDG